MTHSPESPGITTHSPELPDGMTYSPIYLTSVMTHSPEVLDAMTHQWTHSPEFKTVTGALCDTQ